MTSAQYWTAASFLIVIISPLIGLISSAASGISKVDAVKIAVVLCLLTAVALYAYAQVALPMAGIDLDAPALSSIEKEKP